MNTTSSAVNGVPSFHFTPSRSVQISVFGSFHVYSVASHGLASQEYLSYTTSCSKT